MRVSTHRYHAGGWDSDPGSADAARSLLLVFGASSYRQNPEPIMELGLRYPNATILGCSTAGEINGMHVDDDSLALAAIQFHKTPVRFASARIGATTSFEAGESIARQLDAPDLKSVFMLSEGLDVNGTDLTSGISGLLGPDVIVTGGLAADGAVFEDTWVLLDSKPTGGWVTAVGLYGPFIEVGHGSKGGWDIFGPERTVTRSEGNVLYELDRRPALDLYKEYLGELASGLPASGLLYPLSLRAPHDDKQLVRTILGVDEEANSLTFAGDIPLGHRAQLMQATFDRLVDGAEQAAEASMSLSPDAELSIAISCVGRRLVLGDRTEDELEATLHILPDKAKQVGFYSYGEISPFTTGACDLHNQTMTLTTLRESCCIAS